MSKTVTLTTFSSRQFNQDAGSAKKAAKRGPVFITDRGKPAHVLLTMDDYQKLTGSRSKIADLLAMPGVEDLELELPLPREVAQAASLG